MERIELINTYLAKIKERDSLDTVEEEIKSLEEEEIIKRYKRIIKYYENNKYLRNKNDNELLDLVIDEDKDTLDDIWFCCGADYWGHSKMNGGYYIERVTSVPLVRLSLIRLARYRNFKNTHDEVIIPAEQAKAFESDKNVIYANTCFPDIEYYDLRRQMYLDLIKGKELEEGKQLLKK